MSLTSTKGLLVALVLGSALPYFAGVAAALEAVLMQQAYALPTVRETTSLRFFVLYLPTLGLSTLLLAYLLGRLAFSTSSRPNVAEVAAFLLPVALHALWVQHSLSPAPLGQLLRSFVVSAPSSLNWAALALVAVLALVQARRASGAA